MAGSVKKADKTPDEAFNYLGALDEELLERFNFQKDSRALEVLIQRYESPLFNYLFRYLGNREAAEDVFQASFLQVYSKSDQFDPSKKFKPWLYTVATNQAIDYQRRNHRKTTISLDVSYGSEADESTGSLQEILESAEKDPSFSMDTAEQAQRVRAAVDELPDILRETVNLVYFEDLKYKDAADILGVPVGTVKSRLHAAMKKLAEKLAEQNQTDD
ncbi:MAG: RNA polymerase sigma factor [Thermoguttaceae bacterium]|nr:RNA polymerase sigma factor [Thermoguttaceae bacterium]